MTTSQQIMTIGAVIAATMLTRFLPFLLFPANKTTPEQVKYLGRVLPPAIFALLVVYCLRDVNFFTGNHAVPELIAIVFIAFLHFWQRQMLLSIAGGTILYMFLVQYIF